MRSDRLRRAQARLHGQLTMNAKRHKILLAVVTGQRLQGCWVRILKICKRFAHLRWWSQTILTCVEPDEERHESSIEALIGATKTGGLRRWKKRSAPEFLLVFF